jgi:hypothetical protein
MGGFGQCHPVDGPANSARAENDRAAAGKHFCLPVPPLTLGREPQDRGQVRADRGDQRHRVAGRGFVEYAGRVGKNRITVDELRKQQPVDPGRRGGHPAQPTAPAPVLTQPVAGLPQEYVAGLPQEYVAGLPQEYNVCVGGILGQLGTGRDEPDVASRPLARHPAGTASGLTPSTASTDASGANCSRSNSFRH